LFGRRGSRGVDLAVQALAAAMPEDSVRTLATAYIAALMKAYEAG
jgi:hypothetical protein